MGLQQIRARLVPVVHVLDTINRAQEKLDEERVEPVLDQMGDVGVPQTVQTQRRIQPDGTVKKTP